MWILSKSAMLAGVAIALLLTGLADASIMGENNLDDFGQTLCAVNTSDTLGEEAPPVGRLMVVDITGEYAIGSAALVSPPVGPSGKYRRDIVVGAGHSLRNNGIDVNVDGGRFVFRIWERLGPEECVESEYEVAEAVSGFDNPEANWAMDKGGICRHPSYFEHFHPVAIAGGCINPDYDYVILRLTEEVRSYYPLELGDENQVFLARSGAIPVGLVGFAYHESTNFGELLSALSCTLSLPAPGSSYAQHEHLFVHYCDSVPGLSGGPFLLTDHNRLMNTKSASEAEKRAVNRYFVGLAIKGARPDQGEFDPASFFNVGVAVGPQFRSAFESVVAPD